MNPSRIEQDKDEYEDYGNYGMRDEYALRGHARGASDWRWNGRQPASASEYEAYRRQQLGGFAGDFERWRSRRRSEAARADEQPRPPARYTHMPARRGVIAAEGNDITATPSDSPFDFPERGD